MKRRELLKWSAPLIVAVSLPAHAQCSFDCIDEPVLDVVDVVEEIPDEVEEVPTVPQYTDDITDVPLGEKVEYCGIYPETRGCSSAISINCDLDAGVEFPNYSEAIAGNLLGYDIRYPSRGLVGFDDVPIEEVPTNCRNLIFTL